MEVPHPFWIDWKLYFPSSVYGSHKVRVEEDLKPDQLTMADGTTMQTKGKVQLTFKSGRYWGIV